MTVIIKGVTVDNPINSNNPIAQANADVIIEFFSLYIKDREKFYSLWVEDEPVVYTPFQNQDVKTLQCTAHTGWDAVKAFFDAIFYDMKGTFTWEIKEFIVSEDPNTIVTTSHSNVDVQLKGYWGSDKRAQYRGTYVQIFKFIDGKVKSFEEYYDTALLATKLNMD